MSEPDRESRLQTRLILGALLVVIILVFCIENTRRTNIRFLIPIVTAPLWTALFAAALLGALAGALITRHLAAPQLRQPREKRQPSKPPSEGS